MFVVLATQARGDICGGTAATIFSQREEEGNKREQRVPPSNGC